MTDVIDYWQFSFYVKMERQSVIERRHAQCIDSFPRVTCLCCEKKNCFGNKILSPQHVAWDLAAVTPCVMKQGQNDLSFRCRIVCTALPNCPCYNIEINQYPLRVHQIDRPPYVYTHAGRVLCPLRVHAACPLVCVPTSIA